MFAINLPFPLAPLYLFVPAMATATVMLVIALFTGFNGQYALFGRALAGILSPVVTALTFWHEELYTGAVMLSMATTMVAIGLAFFVFLWADESQQTALQLQKLGFNWARGFRYGLYASLSSINTAALDLFHDHIDPAGYLQDPKLSTSLEITAVVIVLCVATNVFRSHPSRATQGLHA